MKIKKLATGFLMSFALGMTIPANVCANEIQVDQTKDIILLYTNDVHCAIDNYGEIAAYGKQLEEKGHKVIIVDAGDHIQGEAIGSMTKGEAIVDLMEMVGYDYAVPGNHEFDYQMGTFLSLAQNAGYEYLSSNFVDLKTGNTVFDSYEIIELGTNDLSNDKVAILGICTPESYTKSTPAYFQDESGNDIYGFSEKNFYQTIQNAVDSAINEGADRVIAVGHLGISGIAEGWKSTDVIANTTGIDVLIDGHAHEVIESASYDNKNGEKVLLSSTGSKFTYFGELTLSADGQTESTKLLVPEDVVVDADSSEAVLDVYNTVEAEIEEYKSQVEALNGTCIGVSEVTLTENDPTDGSWIMRTKETNLGDFVADAYRTISGAEIAIVNSGGIRAEVPEGDITRLSLMNVNPWNNEMCVIEATGQQILDGLEHGVRLHPAECGGFPQVSGLTYEIHNYIESPVVTDEKGSYVEIDNTKERRVKNVKVNGESIDPQKTYTVVGSLYMFKSGGDGYTMFADCKVVKYETLPVDAEMLIQYFTDHLGGKITKEQYGNALGAGRIVAYASEQDVPKDDTSNEEDQKKEDDAQQKDKVAVPKTNDEFNIMLWCSILMMSGCVAGVVYKKKM